MHLRTKKAVLAVLAVLVVTPASAEMRDPVDVFLSGRVQLGGNPLLHGAQRLAPAASQVQMDYAVFVNELVAYIAKEVLPDAADEYAGSSSMSSRLSDSMPRSRSEFGEHCLIVLADIGSHISPFPSGTFSSFSGDSPNFFSMIARAGSALFAVERVWSALRNDIEDKPTGFSLNPKVGTRKVGFYLTFHW